MMISLHLPKTAGTSFKVLLSNNYKRSLYEDYKDFPDNKSFEERTLEAQFLKKQMRFKKYMYLLSNVKCIHGHFLPYKYIDYLKYDSTRFVTWLRDPLERLGSHYHYWVRTYHKDNSLPFHRKVVEENWTLEQFCLSKEMKNLYSNFLWNFPIDKFDFIGITEYIEEDIKYFSEHYLKNSKLKLQHANYNPVLKTKSKYFSDEDLIKEIKSFHEEDYKIYNYALERRKQRIINDKC